jgi:hypothetical protein
MQTLSAGLTSAKVFVQTPKFLLPVSVLLLVVIIVMSIVLNQTQRELSDCQHKNSERFTSVSGDIDNANANANANGNTNTYNTANANANVNANVNGVTAYQTTDASNNAGVIMRSVAQGVNESANTANSFFYQQAQNTGRPGCGNGILLEPHVPFKTSVSGPSMQSAAATYSSNYPNDNSIANLQNGGCVNNDAVHTPNADWSINAQNLMPASWRQDVGCAANVDEGDSHRWAQFAPKYDQYKRYIQASGSARLTVPSRDALRKVIGTRNFLRPGVSVPMTNAVVTPFNESPARLDFIAEHFGYYPGFNAC